jgi:hypothetical protein
MVLKAIGHGGWTLGLESMMEKENEQDLKNSDSYVKESTQI